jgi:hypothetical protein
MSRSRQHKTRHVKSEAVKALEELKFDEHKAKYPNFPYPIKPKYFDSNSNGLTKCVIDFIKVKGFHAERINSTGSMRDNTKTITDVLGRKRTIGSVTWIKSTTQNGTADISATIKGKSIKIEIKCAASGDKYQSEGQKIYQKQIEASGGVYLIVREFSDFYNWFNTFKDE